MNSGGRKRSTHAYYGKHRTRGGRMAAKIGARAKGIIKAFEEIEYENTGTVRGDKIVLGGGEAERTFDIHGRQ